MELINGTVFKNNFLTFTLIFMGDDQWAMLGIAGSRILGMTAPIFRYDKSGKFIFSEKELVEQFDKDNWKSIDGRLQVAIYE